MEGGICYRKDTTEAESGDVKTERVMGMFLPRNWNRAAHEAEAIQINKRNTTIKQAAKKEKQRLRRLNAIRKRKSVSVLGISNFGFGFSFHGHIQRRAAVKRLG